MTGKNKMKSWRLWLIGVGLVLVVGWVLVVCCKKKPSYEELCREYYRRLRETTFAEWDIECEVKKDVDKYYLTSDKNECAKLYKEREEDIRRLR
jgi:hypothetical protein